MQYSSTATRFVHQSQHNNLVQDARAEYPELSFVYSKQFWLLADLLQGSLSCRCCCYSFARHWESMMCVGMRNRESSKDPFQAQDHIGGNHCCSKCLAKSHIGYVSNRPGMYELRISTGPEMSGFHDRVLTPRCDARVLISLYSTV